MKTMPSLFLVLVLFAIFGTAHAGDVTGTWEHVGPAGSGLWLKTKQTNNKVRFQLLLSRGAPSYNSGWIEGEFELVGTIGVYHRIEGGTCEISFEFARNAVRIKETNGRQNCGFGANVHANGTLQRKSAKTPVFSASDPRFGSE